MRNVVERSIWDGDCPNKISCGTLSVVHQLLGVLFVIPRERKRDRN